MSQYPKPCKSFQESDTNIISSIFQPSCFSLKISNHSTGGITGALTSTHRETIRISSMAVAPVLPAPHFNSKANQHITLQPSNYTLTFRSNLDLAQDQMFLQESKEFQAPLVNLPSRQKGIKCSLKAPGGDHKIYLNLNLYLNLKWLR